MHGQMHGTTGAGGVLAKPWGGYVHRMRLLDTRQRPIVSMHEKSPMTVSRAVRSVISTESVLTGEIRTTQGRLPVPSDLRTAPADK